MGGRGSGGHNSKGKLRDVQCARLDVHELARDGKLTLGKRGRLFGTVWFEVAGGPDAQRLVLEFPVRSGSGERLDPVRQEICCYWRPAHYGGRYLMFLCGECGRSARVLYARFENHHYRIWCFACRKCAGITYRHAVLVAGSSSRLYGFGGSRKQFLYPNTPDCQIGPAVTRC
jgi:hypothetical protein